MLRLDYLNYELNLDRAKGGLDGGTDGPPKMGAKPTFHIFVRDVTRSIQGSICPTRLILTVSRKPWHSFVLLPLLKPCPSPSRYFPLSSSLRCGRGVHVEPDRSLRRVRHGQQHRVLRRGTPATYGSGPTATGTPSTARTRGKSPTTRRSRGSRAAQPSRPGSKRSAQVL